MELNRFFLIIPPGLEEHAHRELVDKTSGFDDVTVLKGGIECTASIEWMEEAHLLLKIPTRILLRITSFKVRDFPKLHSKFLSLAWNKVLSHPEPQWEISCSKSRLMHTGRIEETIKDALSKFLVRQPLSLDWQKKNYSPQTFYVRIVDDNLTLSLDLTGEPLYKRGLQVIKGEAPIRENFAAAFLQELLSGIEAPCTLVDPMCGSGTFLTEALTYHRPLHLRPFAFESAPFYKGRLLKLRPETTPLPVKNCLGFDLNGDLLIKVRTELPIEFQAKDSIADDLHLPAESIMICNPPYGERIKIAGKRGEFLRTAYSKFLRVDKPFRFGWVLPSDMDDLFKPIEGYKVMTKRHLKNGGMAVTFWIFEKQMSQGF
jgi:putative N6-adenine-specific DNA methylase